MDILLNSLPLGELSARSSGYTTALAAMALLVLVLVEKELLRAIDDKRFAAWISVLDVAVVPLLFVFTAVVLTRLLALV